MAAATVSVVVEGSFLSVVEVAVTVSEVDGVFPQSVLERGVAAVAKELVPMVSFSCKYL